MSKITLSPYNMSMDSDYSRLSTRAVLDALATDHTGLSPAEAQLRLKAAGKSSPRLMPHWPAYGLKRLVSDSFLVLLLIALLASLRDGTGHASLLLGVVIVWQLWLHIRLFQRGRRFLAHLTASLRTTAAVIRGGHHQHVEADQLVPGDIIELKHGDLVPADVRLLSANQLVIDEQALPGGRPHVRKLAKLGANNLAFFGTTVLAGSGSGVVTARSTDTVLGTELRSLPRIAEYVGAPFEQPLRTLRRSVALLAAALGAGLAIYALLGGMTLADFITAVALLAVALTPTSAPMLAVFKRRSGAVSPQGMLPFVTSALAAKVTLMVISLAGLTSFHIPAATTIVQLLIFDFVVVLLPAALSPAKAGSTAHMPDNIVAVGYGMLAAGLAYAGFLGFFWSRGLSPVNIDPQSHLYGTGASLSLVVLALSQFIDRLAVRRNTLSYLAAALAFLALLACVYFSGLRSLLGTGPLAASDWLIALGTALVYSAARTLQLHTRHHTRHALLRDHPEAIRKHLKLA